MIVALVGNAAEHGGAIVTAHRGHAGLAAEISISSSSQVAVFVAPVIALLSGLVGRGLPLAFRPVEIAAMGGAAIAVALVILDGRAKRWEGVHAHRRLRGRRRRVLDRRRALSASGRLLLPAREDVPGPDQAVALDAEALAALAPRDHAVAAVG